MEVVQNGRSWMRLCVYTRQRRASCLCHSTGQLSSWQQSAMTTDEWQSMTGGAGMLDWHTLLPTTVTWLPPTISMTSNTCGQQHSILRKLRPIYSNSHCDTKVYTHTVRLLSTYCYLAAILPIDSKSRPHIFFWPLFIIFHCPVRLHFIRDPNSLDVVTLLRFVRAASVFYQISSKLICAIFYILSVV